jgi:hypothetical protein
MSVAEAETVLNRAGWVPSHTHSNDTTLCMQNDDTCADAWVHADGVQFGGNCVVHTAAELHAFAVLSEAIASGEVQP